LVVFHRVPSNPSTSKARRLMVCLLLTISAVALASSSARADKRSAVVMVSVQVVPACRVETGTSTVSGSVDLKMRCSSTARPSIGLVGTSQLLPAVASLSVPQSQIAASTNGPTLNIEF
jgi:hypothetical protein